MTVKIYRLTNEDGLNYIGKTTCKYLCQRFAVHKSQALTIRNINKCKSSQLFENGKKVEIFLEEELECDDKDFVRIKEQEYIDKYNCVNKLNPGNSYKQSKQNWLSKNPSYYTNYYDKNKEKINKQWTCNCGLTMLFSSQYRHKKICDKI